VRTDRARCARIVEKVHDPRSVRFNFPTSCARTMQPFATAAGRTDWLQAWLDGKSTTAARSAPAFFRLSPVPAVAADQALVFAGMCGQIKAARLQLGRGVSANRNPPGSHWTATAVRTAAVQGQASVVALLLQRAADPTLRDFRYQSTPIGWLQGARCPRQRLTREVAALLEGRR